MDLPILLTIAIAAFVLTILLISVKRGRSSPGLPDMPPPTDPDPASIPPLSVLATALEDGVLVVEADRRVSYANSAVARLLGRIEGSVVGKTLMSTLRDLEAEQAVERALTTSEPQSVTLYAVRTGRTLRLTCQPIPEDEARALVVIHDLTRLAQLERARREMVANVSHELRTPIASVRLLVETLESDPPPEVASRMLGLIQDELVAITQLVDELSELSQIESGRLALRVAQAELAPLIARAVERLKQQAERHALAIHVRLSPDLPPVLVDQDRIGQVLVNLLHNATKWTGAGGEIEISAQVASETIDPHATGKLASMGNTSWVRLSVRDTGIGIPADEIERVFERFYKVDRARTRDGGGTGLGLAIAKHLVEHHGGRIWAESREGEGSTFHILLPTAERQPTQA
jgi:two-component system, OmpR family, phosphate regulon sensor histidine kinase PhoR